MNVHRASPQAPYTPAVGEVVRDAKHNTEGVYTGRFGNWAYLRPRGGGVEWDTPRTYVERLSGETELVIKLAPDARYSPPWACEEGAA